MKTAVAKVVSAISADGAKRNMARYGFRSDFYSQLANHVVVEYSVAEIKRLLEDPEYLRRQIKDECRAYDLCGPFTDTIIGDLYRNSKKIMVEDAIEKIGDFLFEHFDVERLRKNILEIMDL